MTDQFSIENMKAELARASNKADEDAKTINELKRKYDELSDYTNQIKADAVENARLSIVLHSPPRAGTFLDGADWAFNDMSRQLEDRVSELKNPNNIDFPISLQDEAE